MANNGFQQLQILVTYGYNDYMTKHICWHVTGIHWILSRQRQLVPQLWLFDGPFSLIFHSYGKFPEVNSMKHDAHAPSERLALRRFGRNNKPLHLPQNQKNSLERTCWAFSNKQPSDKFSDDNPDDFFIFIFQFVMSG